MPKTPSSGAYTTKDGQSRECGASDHAKAKCSKQRCYFCQGMGHIETQCRKYYDEYSSMGENEETEKNSADSGEIPKNGNSPEKASASSGVTPSDPQTTTTTTETRKEDQTKENQTKGSQTKIGVEKYIET